MPSEDHRKNPRVFTFTRQFDPLRAKYIKYCKFSLAMKRKRKIKKQLASKQFEFGPSNWATKIWTEKPPPFCALFFVCRNLTLSSILLIGLLLSETASAAVVEVTTINDNLSVPCNSITMANLNMLAGGGGISLREAICAGNNTPGNDLIRFHPSLYLISLPANRVVFPQQLGPLDDDFNIGGDLDIGLANATTPLNNNWLTIMAGVGKRAIIRGRLSPGLADRVFHVHRKAGLRLVRVFVRNGHADSVGGAGILVDQGELRLIRSGVFFNLANERGGGIYNHLGSVKLRRSFVSRNEVVSGNGGGIYNLGGSLTMESSRIGFNIADSSTSAGGGLYQRPQGGESASSVINNSTIISNRADHGGGINNDGLNNGTTSVLRIISSNIVSNHSNFGGGIHYSDANIQLNDVDISSNEAASDGGGIYALGLRGDTSIAGGTISENIAGQEGGGIVLLAGAAYPSVNIQMIGVEFINNIATMGRGGGLLFLGSNSANLELNNTAFISNTAHDDGGGAKLSNLNAQIVHGIFRENISGGKGGGLISNGNVSSNSSFSLVKSFFQGNQAEHYGGGLYLGSYRHDDARLDINTFSGNQSGLNGGGANISASNVTALNNTFSANQSHGRGCGLYISTSYVPSIFETDSTLINNTLTANDCVAGTGGLAVDAINTNLSMYNNLLAGNQGAAMGKELNLVNVQSLQADHNIYGHDVITTNTAIYPINSATPTDLLLTSDSTLPTSVNSLLDPILADNGGVVQTHALPNSSPALNAGNTNWCQPYVSSSCNIGAY